MNDLYQLDLNSLDKKKSELSTQILYFSIICIKN